MNKSNLIKNIGSFLACIAVIFIGYKLYHMEIDYKTIFQGDNVAKLLLLSLLYGLSILVLCIPWKCLVTILTGQKIEFHEAAFIWNKANIMKYIPGNIFQYVARNEIAEIKGISHITVAFATMLDVVINLAGVLLIAAIFYWQGIWKGIEFIRQYGEYRIVILLLVLAVIVIYIFRKKIVEILNRIRKLTIKQIYKCILSGAFYSIWAICASIIFLLILIWILDADLGSQNLLVIAGAFLLSWIIGFILPGVPGGIGVREAAIAMLLYSNGAVREEVILSGIVTYRIVNIIGDLWGVVFAYIIKGLRNKVLRNCKDEKIG